MPANCLDKNLLAYGGTSQAQRALQALEGSYARVDERTASDLILLSKKYSSYLNYYDITNLAAGDWQDIMSKDVAVTIASVAEWPTKDFSFFIEYLSGKIKDATTDNEAQKYFKLYFDFIYSLAVNLDAAFKKLSYDVDYTRFLSVSIASKLALPLNMLSQYYAAFKTASLVDETSTFVDDQMPADAVALSQNFHLADLSSQWQVSVTTPSITLTGTVRDDINHITTHNLFTGTIQSFLDAIINIVNATPDYLEQVLSNYPSHQPHYTLYLTFLRLFRFAQDHLNQFTQRHLDFYYKDVLRLTNRDADPDNVHLIFELQKNIDPYLLRKGTQFKAGKDANKNDIFYALTNDIVIQKASVKDLKSLFLNKNKTPVTLYASPVANSEDGNGAKLSSVDQSWFAFGDPKKIQQPSIGFAIASNILYMSEGERKITVTFSCDNVSGVSVNDLAEIFAIQLTGKKNWYTAESYSPSTNANNLILSITIPGDAPPIIPYSSKLHGGNFTEQLPMIRFLLKDYKSYQTIKSLQVKSIQLQVTASVKDIVLQNDEGKLNAAKPFKPFGEFPEKGASFIIGSKEVFQKPLSELVIQIEWQKLPDADATVSLSARNQEKWKKFSNSVNLFAVSITIRRLSLFILETPSITAASAFSGGGPGASSSSLSSISPISSAITSAGSASTAATTSTSGVSANIIEIAPGFINLIPWFYPTIAGLNDVPQSPADFSPNENYSVNSVDGFIRMQLNEDSFSLKTYLDNIQAPSVTVNYNDDGSVASYTTSKPATVLPSSPLASSVTLTYTATETIPFSETSQAAYDARAHFYFHIEPFGFREMHPFITNDNLSFLPVFNVDDGINKDNGGELWIGFKDASADKTYSVLFEVSEGSANPLKNMTEVDWYYLSNDNWLPFDHLSVSDQTNNLTRSGIVVFTVPSDATTQNNRAESGLLWLKAVVDHDTDAICKLIDVRTNAAKAAFVQDLAKNIEFDKAIDANTVSKPATPVAKLKKTEQPFASFGGRTHETDSQFYQRVSERLRHKHRAVTAWDYERLVLQYFPQVHKAKCLNHTGFISNKKNNTKKYSETLGGHVTVITIPDLTNIRSANPLRPYTSIGLLTEIQQYLHQLTSPFLYTSPEINMRLHVTNPQFEEVQFDFKVSFYQGFDPVFYTGLLNTEIEQFLTPWAFENKTDIEFGGKIEKSVILNFVEERPYVDFVTCFNMYQYIPQDDGTKLRTGNIEEAMASTARSILVSYYDEEKKVKHLISSPANCSC